MTGRIATPHASSVIVIPARGLTRRWRLRNQSEPTAISPAPSPDGATTGQGGAARSIAHRVLLTRGITETADAARFLNPKLNDLLDPSGIPDLDASAARLLRALRDREPIVIYGDYDVDGITATAILYHTLRHIDPGANVSTYVPHRLDEGYGLHVAAIEELARQGAKVIVSVDCGVTALLPAARAQELGVDLIITDHHNPPSSLDDLPRAYAVVHPRRPDSTYAYGELCGAGVAYKLAWRLATMHAPPGEHGPRATPQMRSLLLDLLAFAALGCIADVVPLIGENRVLTRHGLARIRLAENAGLRALIAAAALDNEKIDAWDVGFKLAPRLNASGRMAHAAQAVELFTTANDARAAEIAEFLESQNRHRRATEATILEHAMQMAEQGGMTGQDRRAIVLAHESWHAGVVGIVCSRLVDRFCRPTILMQISTDGTGVVCAHGSGRSIDGFNLHGAIDACSKHLTKFGGHDMAAGLAMPAENVAAFAEDFTCYANENIAPERLTRELTIDCAAAAHELTLEQVVELEQLAPFGRGNPAPAILLRDMVLAAPPQPLGKTGDHLALTIRARVPVGPARLLRVVAWRWGEHRAKLVSGHRLDVVVRPAISTFNGGRTVEPELLDLALA